MRILYIHATVVPPPTDLLTDRFFLLSEHLEGDVLQPVWFQTAEELEAVFGPGSYPVHSVGRFRYHWFLSNGVQTRRRRLEIFWFYLRKGLQLSRERRYDCIVAYSHLTTGLLAGVLKLLTGTRLIIEIATSPEFVGITDVPKPGWREWSKKAYSDLCLHLSMLLANRAHFLYPEQVSAYPLLRRVPNTVFHEFVPVSSIDRPGAGEASEPYVLFVGAPWYLKGVDVLTKAFLKVAPDYPNISLKLLGYFPDIQSLQALIGGSSRIEVLKARPNPETLEVIRRAAVLVLPSRCEGMGRVLIEAMAAGIPLIGSRVGGIPSVLEDGVNGFLVPAGDVEALSAKLRQLLGDAGLRRQMGDRGYERAHCELNEQVYVERFTGMVEATVPSSNSTSKFS